MLCFRSFSNSLYFSAPGKFAKENFLCQHIFNFSTDKALQRSCSQFRVIAFACKPVTGRRCQFKKYFLFRKPVLKVQQNFIHNGCICSMPRLLKAIMASSLFRNSGLKVFSTALVLLLLACILPLSTKPRGLLCISLAPALVVMIKITWRKSAL